MSPGAVSRAARLVVGLALIAVAFSLVLRAHLGLGPWHVLQQGMADHLGISIGESGWLQGAVLLVLALLLRERPGVGTVAAVFLLNLLIDWLLPLIGTPHGLAGRGLTLAGGTLLMGFGAALYLSAHLGASPIDAVMTGLYRRLPVPLFGVRLGLEALGLALGWWAGGEVGIGCLAIGIGIGPMIHGFLRLLRAMPERHLEGVPAGEPALAWEGA